MKIVLRILGILLLLGGIGIVGVFLSSNVVTDVERDVTQSKERVEKLKKEADFTQSPEAKKEYEQERKFLNDFEGELSSRKQTRNIGLIGCGLAIILGLGLFGISFIVGKKKSI